MVTVKTWEGSPSFVGPNLLESPENPSPISADPLIPLSGQRVVQGWLFSQSWDLGELAESALRVLILSIRKCATT